MNYCYKIFVLCFFLLSEIVMATSQIPDFVSLSWIERSYAVIMPPPFNKVRVCIEENDDKSIQNIFFHIDGKKHILEASLLEGLDNLGEPGVFVNNSAIPGDGSVEGFSIIFEYGEGYEIKLKDVPGCKEPCVDWIKNHVTFTVDVEGKISREIKKYERLDLEPPLAR